jgi:hypothetical protein
MATLKMQKARKDYVCSRCKKEIKKGEQYYRFSLTRFQALRVLCLSCKPKPSQMTTSDFLSQMYAIEEDMAALTPEDMEDASSVIENITSQLQDLQSETEEKVDNMPEQFQDGDIAELLRSRAEETESMAGELESVDTDIDEGLEDEERQERLQEILEEIQNIGYNGE